MDHLPIYLELRGQRTVVVGGGHVALRKVELLLKAGARIAVVAPGICSELRGLAENQPDLSLVATSFEPARLDGAVLVIAATDSREINAAVAAAARERRTLVNVVDDAELSTFIFPAIIDRSPVIVAVGSGGRSPVLARRIREWIEALLPARLGALARFLGERRKSVAGALRPTDRRPFWERVLSGPVASRVLAGDEAHADEVFREELIATRRDALRRTVKPAIGEVYLIGAGPGDADLLTLRALQCLQRADVVLYDRLVSEAVLDRARRDALRVFVGKESGDHRMTQERINELMIQYALRGLRVARLKGGDPFVFGRGGEEVEALAARGIPYAVVPGITAALGAAASAGIPLTHRGLARSVTFVTGHTFDGNGLDWRSLAAAHQTVVFYMGVAQLPGIVAGLRRAGAAPELPVAIVERATMTGQRVLRGTLASIVDSSEAAKIAPPALLIVGEVTALTATGHQEYEDLWRTAEATRWATA